MTLYDKKVADPWTKAFITMLIKFINHQSTATMVQWFLVWFQTNETLLNDLQHKAVENPEPKANTGNETRLEDFNNPVVRTNWLVIQGDVWRRFQYCRPSVHHMHSSPVLVLLCSSLQRLNEVLIGISSNHTSLGRTKIRIIVDRNKGEIEVSLTKDLSRE